MREIDILFEKLLSKTITDKEENRLTFLLNDPKIMEYFKSLIKTNFLIDASYNENFKGDTKEFLLNQIRKEKSVFYRYRVYEVLKYAAVVLFFVVGAYLFNQDFFDSSQSKANAKDSNAITITLENGETQTLDENGIVTLKNQQGEVIGEQNGELLNYSKKDNYNTIAYNTISIPHGKRFNIKLSDGTKIFLNAGSTLTYPTNFIKGEQRQVVLRGEAFFEVEKDDDAFVVTTDNLSTTVLGTSFNVSDFQDGHQTEVVLVEGSVALQLQNDIEVNGHNVLLQPGFKASLAKASSQIEISEVDVDLYTSWVDGILVFNNASFDEIMTKLGRYYNVEFINNSKSLSTEKFNARIRFDEENIDQVMTYFEKLHPLEYEIKGDVITIN